MATYSTDRQEPTMSLALVQNFSVSLDGFGTGDGQSRETPFGHAGERLHEWMFRTRWGSSMFSLPGNIVTCRLRTSDSR